MATGVMQSGRRTKALRKRRDMPRDKASGHPILPQSLPTFPLSSKPTFPTTVFPSSAILPSRLFFLDPLRVSHPMLCLLRMFSAWRQQRHIPLSNPPPSSPVSYILDPPAPSVPFSPPSVDKWTRGRGLLDPRRRTSGPAD